MLIRKDYLLIFLFLLSISFAKGQIDLKKENNNENYNLIKKIWFKTQKSVYPLTVVICPYGYWSTSDIYLGHNINNINKHLTNIKIGWIISKEKTNTLDNNDFKEQIETPNHYIYDTTTIDTVTSIFKNIMCNNANVKLPKNFDYRKELIKITDSSNYAIIAKEFKYTFLLRNIEFSKDSCEVLKCIYPLNIYYPYKTSYAIVDLIILGDKIEIVSNTLNTINLLDIKLEKHGKAILKNIDYKRLRKRLNKTTLNTYIDCEVCNYQPYKDFDFVILYERNEKSNSYFLCENIQSVKIKEKEKKTSIDFLSGLYYIIYQLNSNYFGITRKNK